MNIIRLTLILWWIECLYRFEWLLLISGLIGWFNLEAGLVYGVMHLFTISWIQWAIPGNRVRNLTILKDIYES